MAGTKHKVIPNSWVRMHFEANGKSYTDIATELGMTKRKINLYLHHGVGSKKTQARLAEYFRMPYADWMVGYFKGEPVAYYPDISLSESNQMHQI